MSKRNQSESAPSPSGPKLVHLPHEGPAQYAHYSNPAFNNNPLIAACRPPPETAEDALRRLVLAPKFDLAERDEPAVYRRMHVQKLRSFFFPSATHLRVFNSLNADLITGYLHRNPMTTEGQALLHGQRTRINPAAESLARISILTGLSGMGKSALLTRALAGFGTLLIRHTSFQGQSFTESQILYLRRNIPPNCTPRAMCARFGVAVDLTLGTPHYKSEFERRTAGAGTLENALRKVIVNHHIGMLVLDEFQNLSLIGVGADSVIATIIGLCDEYKIPVVIAGTYETYALALRKPALVRRVADRYYDIARPVSSEDPEWIDLCQAAWSYQWVRKPAPFSMEIATTLYECSRGITGIMLSTFEAAQILAMEDGSETVTAKTLKNAYTSRMTMVHPLVRLLEANDSKLFSNYENAYPNCWPTASQDQSPPLVRAKDVRASVESDGHKKGVDAPKKGRARQSSNFQPAPTQTAALVPKSENEFIAALDCDDGAINQQND